MADLAVLREPARLGPVQARNRVFMPAHNVSLPPADYGLYLAERARGGVGLIIAGAFPVHPASARGPGVLPWDPAWADTVRQIVQPARDLGVPVLAQTFHMGASGTRRTDDIAHWGPLVAPSAIPSPAHRAVPQVLQDADIRALIEHFALSARTLQAGGADGVEIHGSHGYLLANFLSPWWNRRDDDWGGDTQRRTRVVREIGHAVRALCGPGFAIGMKLSLDEYLGEAGTTPDETVRVAALLAAEGVFDFVSLSHTDYHGIHRLAPPACAGQSAPLAEGAARVRAVLQPHGIPVLMQGSVDGLPQAADIVRRGQSDLVGFARALIADPEFVAKGLGGRAHEIRRCVGANQGCWARIGQSVSCTVHPGAGRERLYGITVQRPVVAPRRILVVGGGPAGLKFADTAASLGHHVSLWERGDALGGQVRQAAQLPGHHALRHLVDDLAASLQRRGVAVTLGRSADVESVRDFGADQVVLATGARWQTDGFSTYRPDRAAMPTAPGAQLLDPLTALDDPARCGPRVLVVDDWGHYAGLGLARFLAARGRQVLLVTPDALVGRRLEATLERPWVLPQAVAEGVQLRAACTVESVEPGQATLRDALSGTCQRVPADTVVLCQQRRADDALFAALSAAGIRSRRIGDCLAPREIDDAVLEGFREAWASAGPLDD